MNKVFVVERRVRSGKWLPWIAGTSATKVQQARTALQKSPTLLRKHWQFRIRVYSDPEPR